MSSILANVSPISSGVISARLCRPCDVPAVSLLLSPQLSDWFSDWLVLWPPLLPELDEDPVLLPEFQEGSESQEKLLPELSPLLELDEVFQPVELELPEDVPLLPPVFVPWVAFEDWVVRRSSVSPI